MSSGSSDDPYVLLGVDVRADRATVRRAWRQLALRWHPDRAGVAHIATFRRIQAAYALLSDPAARARHDATRPPAEPPPRTPGVMIQRLSGPLAALLACGVARRASDEIIELFLGADEIADGGMVTISMRVPVRSASTGEIRDELFSAWLAVPPGVVDGAVLKPSALLRGMVHPVAFRVRVPGAP